MMLYLHHSLDKIVLNQIKSSEHRGWREQSTAYWRQANAYQIAMLNKMVPKAYKFDILEVV